MRRKKKEWWLDYIKETVSENIDDVLKGKLEKFDLGQIVHVEIHKFLLSLWMIFIFTMVIQVGVR